MSDLPPVLILSGGLGTRLREAHPSCPKAMAPVNGEPFIAHQLRLLAGKGIKEALICTGYKGEQIVDFVGNGDKFNIACTYSHDGQSALGTGGAVMKALHLVPAHFFVMYGDSYLDVSFAGVYEAFQESNCLGLMTVFKKKQGRCNTLFSGGRILGYNKENPNESMHFVDFGLLVFSRQAFSGLPANQAFDLSLAFKLLIQSNQLAGLEMFTPYFEIGTPQGLLGLEVYLQSEKANA